jgi:hypothetical protein
VPDDAVTAEVVVIEPGAEGVIVAQGGSISGWSLYAKDGKPTDGEKLGGGQVGATAAMVFSADDTCDVGMEGGAVVSEDYGPRGNEFTGDVNRVQVDLGHDAADADRFLTAEERFMIAMARQ